MFQTKVVEKIKTHILCSLNFFRKSYRLRDNVEKYCTAVQAVDDKLMRRRKDVVFVLDDYGKNTEKLIIFNTYCFARKHQLRKRPSVLHYIYAAGIVKVLF
jgi:hypothetical protein